MVNHPITDKILTWYAQHQRDLPWRKTRNPYFIWISEIMLQQTQVETVIPYYKRFLSRFPTIRSLAKSSLDDVLKVWENLGYYSRARNLHAAAREIMTKGKGKVPKTLEGLLSLPGLGPYTAAAVLSFAFGERIAAVDGNARRVISRLFAIEESLHLGKTQRRISAIAGELVPEKDSASFNQGLMDLGASICSPRKPSCDLCTLSNLCQAFRTGLQDSLPVNKKRDPLPHKDIMAGIIADAKGRLLIAQRPMTGLLGGLWKFPGGERVPKETLKDALERSVREELGIRIRVRKPMISVKHAYTHFRISLHAFHCRLEAGHPRALTCLRWRWVRPSDLNRFPFSKAERKIIAAF
jgi:A/G-specific adenine glycosylase